MHGNGGEIDGDRSDDRLDAETARELNLLLDAMGVELARRVEVRGARRPWIAWSGLGALAAAALAALTLIGPGDLADSGGAGPAPGDDAPASGGEGVPAPGLDVEAPGPFLVFPTSDEDITVIWLLGEG
jgi:hypothetical protein